MILLNFLKKNCMKLRKAMGAPGVPPLDPPVTSALVAVRAITCRAGLIRTRLIRSCNYSKFLVKYYPIIFLSLPTNDFELTVPDLYCDSILCFTASQWNCEKVMFSFCSGGRGSHLTITMMYYHVWSAQADGAYPTGMLPCYFL